MEVVILLSCASVSFSTDSDLDDFCWLTPLSPRISLTTELGMGVGRRLSVQLNKQIFAAVLKLPNRK